MLFVGFESGAAGLCAQLVGAASNAHASINVNCDRKLGRIFLITMVTWADFTPIARMRPSAGTCHLPIIVLSTSQCSLRSR